DGPGEGGGGVERGDPDRVGDELGLNVQDLLTGVDLAQWQPGGNGAVGFLGGVQVRSASAARRPAVSPSWSLLVISTDTPGGGDTASSRAASVAARARSYLALAARTLVWAFFFAGVGTIRVGSSSVVAYASWESRSKCIR